MKIRPEQLAENGYTLLDSLNHKELIPFVQTYLKKRTKYSIIYLVSNLIIFGVALYLLAKGYDSPNYEFSKRFIRFAYGLGLALALLPLHEYIHVLAYESQGATHTSYDANLKKFYFMALADKFVANKKEFEIVALAPFVTITTILTLSLFIVNSNWVLTGVGALLAHTSMCSGDFGLLSYFEANKSKQVVTYDNVEEKMSYFYGKFEEGKTTA